MQIIFGHKIICEPIFNIFVALFTTFGMQKDDKITFSWRCFRTRRYAKRQFPKDGVRRVDEVQCLTVRADLPFIHKC